MIFNMCITYKKLYITTCKISIVDNAVKLSKLHIIESYFGIYKYKTVERCILFN